MIKKNFFLFGFGQVAKYLIKQIGKKNHNSFFLTSTKKTQTRKILNRNLKVFYFKNNKYDKKIRSFLKKSDYILVSIPPNKKGDLVVKNFKNILKKKTFKKLIYLSATNVYGNHNGKWVTEESKLKAKTTNGKNRMLAEKQWLSLKKKYNLNIDILRLGGIYSKENNAIKRLKAGSAIFVKKDNHYFSRIRVEDIVQIIEKIFSKNKKIFGEIFNVSDDLPASNEQVVKFAARLLKIKKLNKIDFKKIKPSKMKNFYKESKRVKNRKMKKLLKIKLKFPTFKDGLRNLKNQSI
jgi:nucleoside-diphosphate-sugar epimerase